MPIITLPDGSQKSFEEAPSVLAVAESIGAGLAKATLAAEVNGQLVDVSFIISHDATIKLITDKDEVGLDIIRHSTAHLLAQAVKRLFPQAQVGIGPTTDDGCYYDFSLKNTDKKAFTPEDIEKIEAQMQKITQENYTVTRHELTRPEAIRLFQEKGEHYKVKIIEDIPGNEPLSIYQQGEFVDLCRGPHVPRTGLLKAYKITRLAGAYWRGDSRNEMLQRIYVTAWANPKQLKTYLHQLEEAKKRDHRELGKKMALFHFQPEAPGMVFWHPNGWTVMTLMKTYIRERLQQWGYQEINTPQLVDETLWEKSGHMAKFSDDMFGTEVEGRRYAVKPMSCPCHVQVFKQGLHSYRQLPLRYAEFGGCHRNEPSGTLHGLMRLRGFTQDDAHIFCTESQIQAEAKAFISQVHQVYADFGFTEISHKLSTRPEKRVGSDDVWDKAEQALQIALDDLNVDWQLQAGEGAFYGPKIEFSLKDCIGRVWQCGTLQLDFAMPERLGAFYINEQGEKQTPVMLHRAILGSLERFLGVVLEHYAGRLPVWLAPIQVVLMNITDKQLAFVSKVLENLQFCGIRVKADTRNEKIGFKVREHTIARVPYQVVVGDQEVANQTLAVKRAGSDQTQTMSVDELIKQITNESQGGGKQPLA